MEMEEEIPFLDNYQTLVENREFKRTLVLWLSYTKGLEPPMIHEYTGYARSTIQEILKKWQNEGTIKDLPRQGRPKEMTSEVENIIIETQLENRYKYGTDIFKELNERGVDVSYDQTIRTIREKFKTVNSPFRLSITPENKAKRVSWIHDHSTWRTAKWMKVVWTDEKAFELYPQGGQLHAKILPDESPDDFPRQKIQKVGKK